MYTTARHKLSEVSFEIRWFHRKYRMDDFSGFGTVRFVTVPYHTNSFRPFFVDDISALTMEINHRSNGTNWGVAAPPSRESLLYLFLWGGEGMWEVRSVRPNRPNHCSGNSNCTLFPKRVPTLSLFCVQT